jgi:hypothetical protein
MIAAPNWRKIEASPVQPVVTDDRDHYCVGRLSPRHHGPPEHD